jgi:hypothetical protein
MSFVVPWSYLYVDIFVAIKDKYVFGVEEEGSPKMNFSD